ncbi:Crp/Fnr family transcriptional regulator [Pedobacter sp. GSP4]|uniref:Crp/Fnr family transcriptional regulator n=1 Tax=Pedobacter sp. GSP4 TaxID=3453716 RepID=UPI003EECE018
MDISLLINYFNKISPLTEEMEQAIRSKVRKLQYKRDDLIPNNPYPELLFVIEGLLIGYVDVDELGIASWLAQEGELTLTSQIPLGRESGPERIVAIEDTHALAIPADLFEGLSGNRIQSQRFERALWKHFLSTARQRSLLVSLHSARRRLEIFRLNQPGLEKRVPDEALASYLGITVHLLRRAQQGTAA